MLGVRVGRRMHGDRLDAELAARADDAQGDLAAVGANSGWPNSTGCPFSTRMVSHAGRRTRSRSSALIASMMARWRPYRALSPISTNGLAPGAGPVEGADPLPRLTIGPARAAHGQARREILELPGPRPLRAACGVPLKGTAAVERRRAVCHDDECCPALMEIWRCGRPRTGRFWGCPPVRTVCPRRCSTLRRTLYPPIGGSYRRIEQLAGNRLGLSGFRMPSWVWTMAPCGRGPP